MESLYKRAIYFASDKIIEVEKTNKIKKITITNNFDFHYKIKMLKKKCSRLNFFLLP